MDRGGGVRGKSEWLRALAGEEQEGAEERPPLPFFCLFSVALYLLLASLPHVA